MKTSQINLPSKIIYSVNDQHKGATRQRNGGDFSSLFFCYSQIVVPDLQFNCMLTASVTLLYNATQLNYMNLGLMLLVVVLCVALVIVAPIISIWAINTLLVGPLFVKPIELTLWTYLAMLWTGGLFGAIFKSAS